jgi:hypothetical protein
MIMLVKFNKRGKGGSAGPLSYLLGDFGTVDNKMPTLAERKLGVGKRSVKPLVLRGDVEQTANLIDSLSFARNYTSGCLTFSEADLANKNKEQLMDSFENAIFSGLDNDQYDVLWIEHRDKGRLELNFLIPNVELRSGKRLQPYFDRADRTRINAWQTMTNGQLDLADPHDPANKSDFTFPSNLPRDRLDAAKIITDTLIFKAGVGKVIDRNSVVKVLQNSGYIVSRQTKNSISIKQNGSDRPLRLKGEIYEQSFSSSTDFRAERQAAIAEYKEKRQQRIRDSEQTYSDASKTKREYHFERFQKPPEDKPVRVRQSDISSDTNFDNRRDNRRSNTDRLTNSGHAAKLDKINNWVKQHERSTEATSISNQIIRTKASSTTECTSTTVNRISDAIKRLTESVGQYAKSAIELSRVRRDQRYKNQQNPSFRP